MKTVESLRFILGGRRLQLRFVAVFLAVMTVILAAVRFFQDGNSSVVSMQLGLALVFLITAFLFQTRFEKTARHLVILAGLCGIFSIAFFSGGIASQSMFWLPFIPLSAAFLMSYRSTVAYTFAALVGLVLMWSQSESSTIHYITLGAAVGFSCVLGIFLEQSRIIYEDKLSELATKHPLTGLPTRIIFDPMLARTVDLLSRQSIPYVLVFIDVDGLKEVNTVFGHSAGDALLKEIGLRLDKAVNSSEALFHLSGDEFAIIADEATSLDTLKERIRSIRGEFVYMNFRIPLNISVGATHGTTDSEICFASADSDMLQDKRSRSADPLALPPSS